MVKPTLSDIIIELHVDDFNKAKWFYSILGFAVVWENSPTSASDGYLAMKKGNSYICFNGGSNHVYKQPYFERFPVNTKRGYAVEIAIPTNDIKGLYHEIKDKLEDYIVETLCQKLWKKWEFRLTDPFGFYLRFTEPVNINYKD